MSAASAIPVEASVNSLRTIAHELRQPLSTIESIAYYLGLVLPREDTRVHEQLSRLQQLVEQSNWILSSGLQLAECAPAAPQSIDLEELVTDAVALQSARGDGIVRLELGGKLPLAKLDPGQGRAMIVNLLTLFRLVSTEKNPVTVRTSAGSAGQAVLEMFTAVHGYHTEASLGAGAALGLACARRTVESSGGSLSLSVDPVAGIRLTVMLG
jgi:C4-dicarboxylate-specific signal transduction histidine kinase